MLVSPSEGYKQIIEDLRDGDNSTLSPLENSHEVRATMMRQHDSPTAQAHHKEGVKARALTLMRLLHEITDLNSGELETRDQLMRSSYHEYCQQIQQITNTKVQLALSVYIVTRCPDIFTYLSSLATSAYDVVRTEGGSATNDRIVSISKRAFNAIWLLVARVLTNNYSLDIRILICENLDLIRSMVFPSLDPRIYLDSEQADQSFLSKLAKILDVFGLSPYWNDFVVASKGEAIITPLLTSIDSSLDKYQQDSMNGLLGVIESLRTVLMLSIVSDHFCTSLSKVSAVTSRVVSLVLTIAEFVDLEWALLNMLWLAEMNTMGFPNTAASLGADDDAEIVHLTLPVLVSGHCLTLLHVVGRNPQGAMYLAASGGRTLKAIKKFVNIHSEDLLKKTGLWPMVVALIPSCSLGVTTSCNDPSLISVRRLKHYNILLPCTCCSKVAIGSRQLKICGECHLIRYCGRECQQNDWQDGHNTLCKHFLTMK